VARVSSDVDIITQFTQAGGVTLLISLLQMGIATVVMLWYSWVLALVVLACFVPAALLMRAAQRRVAARYRQLRRDVGELYGVLGEAASGAVTVRSYGVEELSQRRLEAAVALLASLLDRSGFEVVGQAGDAAQLLELVHDAEPELAIVDIRMPPAHATEGLDAAKQIRRDRPDMGILVLSAHAEVDHAMELLASGRGIGYLLKSRVSDVAEFIETLERIARGGSVVDPALVQELVTARKRNDPLAVVSERERDVLSLMAEGRSNAGIARRLWITEGTVEKHVRSILTKLGLSDTDDDHRRVLAVLTYLEKR